MRTRDETFKGHKDFSYNKNANIAILESWFFGFEEAVQTGQEMAWNHSGHICESPEQKRLPRHCKIVHYAFASLWSGGKLCCTVKSTGWSKNCDTFRMTFMNQRIPTMSTLSVLHQARVNRAHPPVKISTVWEAGLHSEYVACYILRPGHICIVVAHIQINDWRLIVWTVSEWTGSHCDTSVSSTLHLQAYIKAIFTGSCGGRVCLKRQSRHRSKLHGQNGIRLIWSFLAIIPSTFVV